MGVLAPHDRAFSQCRPDLRRDRCGPQIPKVVPAPRLPEKSVARTHDHEIKSLALQRTKLMKLNSSMAFLNEIVLTRYQSRDMQFDPGTRDKT